MRWILWTPILVEIGTFLMLPLFAYLLITITRYWLRVWNIMMPAILGSWSVGLVHYFIIMIAYQSGHRALRTASLMWYSDAPSWITCNDQYFKADSSLPMEYTPPSLHMTWAWWWMHPRAEFWAPLCHIKYDAARINTLLNMDDIHTNVPLSFADVWTQHSPGGIVSVVTTQLETEYHTNVGYETSGIRWRKDNIYDSGDPYKNAPLTAPNMYNCSLLFSDKHIPTAKPQHMIGVPLPLPNGRPSRSHTALWSLARRHGVPFLTFDLSSLLVRPYLSGHPREYPCRHYVRQSFVPPDDLEEFQTLCSKPRHGKSLRLVGEPDRLLMDLLTTSVSLIGHTIMERHQLLRANNECDGLQLRFLQWRHILRLSIAYSIRYGNKPLHNGRHEAAHAAAGRPEHVQSPPFWGLGDLDQWHFPWIVVSRLPSGLLFSPLSLLSVPLMRLSNHLIVARLWFEAMSSSNSTMCRNTDGQSLLEQFIATVFEMSRSARTAHMIITDDDAEWRPYASSSVQKIARSILSLCIIEMSVIVDRRYTVIH
jgi:hypothetical protein